MSETIRTEVAIIGAGPAGSTLGTLLAGKGIDVVILDRDLFPRDKLCGEFLSYDALPVLELIDMNGRLQEAGATQIRRCRIVGQRREVEFELPLPARGISRLTLDHLLLRRAAEAGTRVMEGWTAERIVHDGQKVRVEISRGETIATLETAIVAGAWGRWGRIDKQLGRPFFNDTSHRHFGFKRHYRPVNGMRSDSIDLYSFDGGYLGVSGVEGGITNICGLVHQSRLSGNKGGWDGFVQTLKEKNRPLERLYASHEPAQDGFLSSDPVIFRAKSAAERGMLLIGDAAGIIDPLTGSGMAMAMQSALLAATAIVSRLGGSEPFHADHDYARRHDDFFRSRLRWSRRVARLLSNPRLLETLLATIPSPAIGRWLLGKTRASRRQLDSAIEQWNILSS